MIRDGQSPRAPGKTLHQQIDGDWAYRDDPPEDPGPSIETRLVDAIDEATRLTARVNIEIETPTPEGAISGRVGEVKIPPGGTIVLSDPETTTLDDALGRHGWEAGSIVYGPRSVRISVWREDA